MKYSRDNYHNDLTLLPSLYVDDTLDPLFSGLLDANGYPLVREKEVGFFKLREKRT